MPRVAKKDIKESPRNDDSPFNKLDPALQRALDSIESQHGKGSVFILDSNAHIDIPVISTGSLTVDIATGVGGIPRGRVTEIYGPESSGKTTLCLHAIAQAQADGGMAAFIDMEHALDPNWARRLGCNLSRLIISQPESGEQALQITEDLIKSGVLSIVVIDSVAALVPRVEIEGEMGDSHVGLLARLMAQALRKLNALIKSTNVAVVFTNQIREKIGVSYGNPETQPGGRALKFYASLRLDVRKLESIKTGGGEAVGSRTRVRVTKNKVAPPFREAEFDIMYVEGGISRAGEIVDLAAELNIIEKRGAFYRYNDGLLGQGRENAKKALKDQPQLAFEIENAVRATYGVKLLSAPPQLIVDDPVSVSVSQTEDLNRPDLRQEGDDEDFSDLLGDDTFEDE